LGTLAQLGIKLLRGKTHPHPLEFVIWIGGLLLTLFITTLLARLAVKMMREIENENRSGVNEPENDKKSG
jgi:hypothetical protein